MGAWNFQFIQSPNIYKETSKNKVEKQWTFIKNYEALAKILELLLMDL